jgi:hypothetical protein
MGLLELNASLGTKVDIELKLSLKDSVRNAYS